MGSFGRYGPKTSTSIIIKWIKFTKKKTQRKVLFFLPHISTTNKGIYCKSDFAIKKVHEFLVLIRLAQIFAISTLSPLKMLSELTNISKIQDRFILNAEKSWILNDHVSQHSGLFKLGGWGG